MHLYRTDPLLSATDLSGFVACPHLTTLNQRAALGGPESPQFDDPSTDVVRQRGLEHEAELLNEFREEGVCDCGDPGG